MKRGAAKDISSGFNGIQVVFIISKISSSFSQETQSLKELGAFTRLLIFLGRLGCDQNYLQIPPITQELAFSQVTPLLPRNDIFVSCIFLQQFFYLTRCALLWQGGYQSTKALLGDFQNNQREREPLLDMGPQFSKLPKVKFKSPPRITFLFMRKGFSFILFQ